MYVPRLRAVSQFGLRTLVGLMLALTIAPWLSGAPLPVHAATAPKYRLQVIVKSVHVYDDRDWHGAGDMRLAAILYLCPEAPQPCVPGEPGLRYRAVHVHAFDGWTGLYHRVNLTLPHTTTEAWGGYDLSEGAGYPMYEGERYLLRFEMRDKDDDETAGGPDYMGWVDIWLDEETGDQLRAHSQDAAKGGGKRGDYRLDYEVMLTQLPNLMPTSLDHYAVPGSTDSLVCVGVVNTGAEPSGSFPVTLKIDGKVARDGMMNGGDIGPGQFAQVCTQTQLPSPNARHEWAAIVDEAGVIPEMVERDNMIAEVLYPGPGAGPAPVGSSASPWSPSPAPTSGQTGADLAVSAIQVNGQAPDGKDDCKDGKHRVAVVVKNGGTANAGSFAVQLAVDGEQAAEQPSAGLGRQGAGGPLRGRPTQEGHAHADRRRRCEADGRRGQGGQQRAEGHRAVQGRRLSRRPRKDSPVVRGPSPTVTRDGEEPSARGAWRGPGVRRGRTASGRAAAPALSAPGSSASPSTVEDGSFEPRVRSSTWVGSSESSRSSAASVGSAGSASRAARSSTTAVRCSSSRMSDASVTTRAPSRMNWFGSGRERAEDAARAPRRRRGPARRRGSRCSSRRSSGRPRPPAWPAPAPRRSDCGAGSSSRPAASRAGTRSSSAPFWAIWSASARFSSG